MDFGTLFREVQAGHKPIDALLEDATFRKRFLEAITALDYVIITPESDEEELADGLASKIFCKATRARDSSLPHLEFDYTRELELEFDDLVANMQSTKSKRAVAKAFAASPSQLGRAAVKQARKNG